MDKLQGAVQGSSSTMYCLCYHISSVRLLIQRQESKSCTCLSLSGNPKSFFLPSVRDFWLQPSAKFAQREAAEQEQYLSPLVLRAHWALTTGIFVRLFKIPLPALTQGTVSHCHSVYTLTRNRVGYVSLPAQRVFKHSSLVAAVPPPLSAEFRSGSCPCNNRPSGGSAITMLKYLVFLPPGCC